MLEPCLLGIECFENGTRIDAINNGTRDGSDIDSDSFLLQSSTLNQQGTT